MIFGDQQMLMVNSFCNLAYLCYAITQFPVQVSSGIGDDDSDIIASYHVPEEQR